MSVPKTSTGGEPKRGAERDEIIVRGARVHNLKNLDVEIPLEKLTVITGVSGCGKSSLAYDTLFAEGRRIYLESLTSGTGRQAGSLDPVDVDSIENLPPPLCVAQHPGLIRRRSTVGTVTEVSDYLRLLYSRVGIPHCPNCGNLIAQSHPNEIVERILRLESGRKAMLLAPLVRGRKGTHVELFDTAVRDGFVRVRIDGELHDLAALPKLVKSKPHTIELVIDRIIIKAGLQDRLGESVNLTLKKGEGSCLVAVQTESGWEDHLYSSRFVCSACGLSLPEIEPRTFNFNSPYGACSLCSGLGCLEDSIETPCLECSGDRLNGVARAVRLGSLTLPDFCRLNLDEAGKRLAEWQSLLKEEDDSGAFKAGTHHIAMPLLKSLSDRLESLREVGLSYLTLDRSVETLSGGEFQRVRIAEVLGNRLCGACYILDEPTAGLHPSDTNRLMKVLEALRDQGNTILIIEHDLQVASRADHLIELGPGAGKEGGRLLAEGSPRSVRETEGSTTGPYLRGANRKLLSRNRDCGAVESLRLSAANLHNLKSVDLEIPQGRFVCVTGVSGSGKSSLVGRSLIPLLRHHVAAAANPRWTGDPEIPPKLNALGTLSGYEFLKRVVEVDQSPLGRNSRSNPATVSGIWDEIRRLFAATREARSRGFKTKQFSMNSAEGRCPACRGRGTRKLTIEFLSDIEVNCETCRGNRFNPETLAVRYKGLNVAEVLALSVVDSLDFFAAHERIHKVLRTFAEVGLGYLPLGQSSRNLSGGEAQRVKLASALVNEEQGGTFYFLDEPTTGLHSADVERLVELLQHLVDRGNTLIAIEHQPYFIGAADWVVELGPGGGPSGGRVIETGPPSRLIDSGTGATARSLASWISG